MAERGAFLQSGSYSAESMRQALNGLWLPEGVASSLKPRSGVVPGYGGDMAVSQNGTPNMSVNVATGRALVAGSTSAVQGGYTFLNDGTKNVTISTAHATLPRKDIIVVQVEDSSYSGAVDGFSIKAITGTPAASPAAPAVPASSLLLAEVLIAAADTSIVNADITDKRTYTTNYGGKARVANSTERLAIAAPYIGMEVIQADTKETWEWNGTAWRGGWEAWTPTWRANAQTVTQQSPQSWARYRLDGKTCHIRGYLYAGSAHATGADWEFSLPFSSAAPGTTGQMPVGTSAHTSNNASWSYGQIVSLQSNPAIVKIQISSNPFFAGIVASGDQWEFAGAYEVSTAA